uniref:Uncharacterized protein n=1 Tax=Coccidioides posadasii RMSCC 3488 TaxID=454284 RepID=A0A0J6FKT3_COCPO|nr:hypothetical protein CPAG_05769 [Coccidioides posadasii RMSCC 3488]
MQAQSGMNPIQPNSGSRTDLSTLSRQLYPSTRRHEAEGGSKAPAPRLRPKRRGKNAIHAERCAEEEQGGDFGFLSGVSKFVIQGLSLAKSPPSVRDVSAREGLATP